MRRIATAIVVVIALVLLASACGGSSGGGATSQDPFVGHWKQENGGAMSYTATAIGSGSYHVVWQNPDGSTITVDVHTIGNMWGTDDGSWSFEPLRPGEMTVLYPLSNGLMGQVALTR